MPRKVYLLEVQSWIQVESLVPSQVSDLGCRMFGMLQELKEVRLREGMVKMDMEL
jgi:hypothetical protein